MLRSVFLYVLLIFTLIFVCVVEIQAQDEAFSYFKYDSKNGLPCNETYRVFQDSRGFIWITTDHGLVKYDGYTFKVFTTQDGLINNAVFDIAEDNKGRLWLNTYISGICFGNENGFAPHPANALIIGIAKEFGFYRAAMDNTGNWWMSVLRHPASDYEAICLSDTALTYYRRENKNAADEVFYLNVGNNLFLKAKGYTEKLDKDLAERFKDTEKITFSEKEFKPLQQYEMGSVFGSSDADYLYYVTERMLFVLSKKTKQIVSTIQFKNVVNQFKIIGNDVWVSALNNGVSKYEWIDNQLQETGHFFKSHTVSDVLKDREGNYWFSTTDAGVFFVPSINITVVKSDNESVQGQLKVTWLGILKNQLYAGTANAQRIRVNEHPEELDMQTAPIAGTVTDMLELNGKVYTNTEIFKRITANDMLAYPMQLKQVDNYPGNRIIAAGKGGVLIADERFNLKWMSVSSGFTEQVSSLLHLSDSAYYLGAEKGIYLMRGRTIKLFYTSELLKKAKIKDIKLNSEKQQLIVATKGAGIMMIENGKVNYLTEKDGLASNLCEEIVIENDSVFWVATYSGISKVAYHSTAGNRTASIINYTVKDGLISNQVNAIQKYRNKIWVGTDEGLSYFVANEIEPDKAEIPVFFNSLKINGTELNLDSALTFEHDQNNITVEFVALHFRSQGDIRYKVKLKDENEWIVTNNNSIQYFGLEPGEYNISIMAEDKHGNYYSKVKSLYFTINPKLTERLWFRAAIALIILVILSSAVAYFIQTEKTKTRNKILLLQSEYKALNYQINPHFIFNIFNSIQYFIVKKNTEKAIAFLNSFSNHIRKIMTNAGQTQISVLDECESLEEYLNLEQMRMDNSFTYNISIESNVKIEQKLILPMIIQPVVENSIWHGVSQSDRNCHITVSFKQINNRVSCIIEDDGIGLKKQKALNENPNKKSLSIALENIKERLRMVADLHNSEWSFTITDRSDIDPSLSGTKVVIEFPKI